MQRIRRPSEPRPAQRAAGALARARHLTRRLAPHLALAGAVLDGLLCLARPAAAQEDTGPPAPSPPAEVDTVLPRSGLDPTVSDLREHLLQSYGDAAPNVRASGPDLQINGQFGLSEEYTDNVGLAGGGAGSRSGDFITQFSPGITVVDTSQRLRVSLDYAPTGQVYAENSSFSQFAQQGTGDVLATLLPGWLYADLRGAISQQSVYGGLGPSSTVALAPNDRQTDSSLSFSPYLSRQFGTHGSVQIGGGYVYSATDAPGGRAAAPAVFDGAGAYGNSYLATERGFASYETGEDLGRVRNKVGTDDSFYSGSGALAGGRRLLFTDDASYALTRLVTLLGEAGYEDLSYPRSDFAYSGPVAAGGVKLTPKPGSYLTIEYRYLDGFGSAYVQGSVQATARVRLFGGYSSGISTFQQDQQTSLLDGESDSITGAAASVLQAAPLLQSDNSFGANQNLNRTHRLDATATYLGDRDTATVSVSRQTTTPVGRQVGPFAQVSTSGVFGSVSLSHDLSPDISLTGFVQYGSNTDGLAQGRQSAGSGQTVSVSLGLNRVFSRTLSGYVRYGGTYLVGGSDFGASGTQGLGNGQSTITLGAVKRF